MTESEDYFFLKLLSGIGPVRAKRLIYPSANPVRIGITQPRVARNELPWVGPFTFPTLKGLKQTGQRSVTRVLQPLQGWPEGMLTQGRSRRAGTNPGLSDHNPVGVEANRREGSFDLAQHGGRSPLQRNSA